MVRPDRQSEGGFSLIELLVAMTVLTIVMIMVFATIGWIVGAEGRVESVSNSSSQIDQAFIQIEGEVRYAADINQPGSLNGNWFVEFESDWTTSTLGAPQCTQLEYNTTQGDIQQRTWLVGSTVPATTVNDWRVLASGLAKSTSSSTVGDPFTLNETTPIFTSATTTAPTTTVPATTVPSTTTTTVAGTTTTTIGLPTEVGETPWQLTITLAASAGYGPTAATSQSSFTVSALNVTTGSVDTGICGGTPTS